MASETAADRTLGPSVLLVSASVLCFEVVLLRLFAVETFYHLTYMAVGLALLGFAASGTILVLVRNRVAGLERGLFNGLVALTPVMLLVAPVLAHLPDYDPTQLLWDPRQWIALAMVYGSLSLPFLTGGGAVALALQMAGERVGRVYAWNMVGAGAGTLLAIPLLILFRPHDALAATAFPAGLAAALALLGVRRSPARVAMTLGLVVLVSVAVWRPPWSLEITHFKALPQVQAYPEARNVGERWDATGWAVAITSPAVHHAPGLSLAYRGPLPPQTGLFVDGASAGAVTHGLSAGDGPGYLAWLPSAAAYATGPANSVLILGSGGGTEISSALAHGAHRVVAVEVVRPLVELVRQVTAGAPGPYDAPGVEVVTVDARAYVARARERFDRIVLSPAGVFNAAASGILSGGEDFLNTTEAYRSYFDRLAPGGILSVTRWLRNPPRDNVRMILTVAEALRSTGIRDVEGTLVFLRSWATGTVLVKPDGFTPKELDSLRDFARRRYFDVDWPPPVGGVREVHNLIREPVFEDAARAVTSGREATASFARDYPFDIVAPTDDRPYFGRFLRLRTLPLLLRRGPGDWLPVAEWGTLAVVATLLQSLALAVIVMGVPVLVLTRPTERRRMPVGRMAAYFTAIGLGYLFIEMAAIQKLSLVLGHPVYATAATLAALLAFSGIGSAWSDRLHNRLCGVVCSVVAGVAVVSALAAPSAGAIMVLPLPARAAMALIFVAAAGVVMGAPFPMGLRRLAMAPGGVAWAWAANGVASVAGASLAILLSMAVGTRLLILAGGACYLFAAMVMGWRPTSLRTPVPHTLTLGGDGQRRVQGGQG